MNKSFWLSTLFSQLFFFIILPYLLDLFSYLHPIVMVVVWVCFTSAIFFITYLIRKDHIVFPKTLFNLCILLYTLCLLVLLFIRPSAASLHNWNLIPLKTISFYFTGDVSPLVAFYNLAANIGLFIPYGLYGMFSNKNTFLRFILPFLAITAIEVLQLITHRGSLDIDDLILNMIGVYIGYFFYPVFCRVVLFDKQKQITSR